MLPAEFSRDPERLARFEREAKLLASLNHANLATLYGLEESDDHQFLAMELVEGETLAERIARGPGMMASQRSHGRVATVAIDAMSFDLPVFVGDIVCVYTEITRIGRTSMRIHVEAWALRDRIGERVKATEGQFTFVAIDENRKPRPIPDA